MAVATFSLNHADSCTLDCWPSTATPGTRASSAAAPCAAAASQEVAQMLREQSFQTLGVLRVRRFRTPVEGLTNLAHEVEAEERRVEPNRRALLLRRCEQIAPVIGVVR